MRPDQLGDYRIPGDVQHHPSSDAFVFVTTQMDLDGDKYRRHLWINGEGRLARLTEGEMDYSPRWSPVGATIAFIRKEADEKAKPQLAVRGRDRVVRIVTDFDLGVSELAWSPDGSTIAVVSSEYIDGFEDDEERERAPRRITEPAFRFDNKSWTYNVRSHIWLVDVESGEVTQLTSGEHSENHPAWSPDGTTIAFVSSTEEKPWMEALETVYTVSVAGRSAPAPVTPRGDWVWCGYDASGSLLALGSATDVPSLELSQFHRLDGSGNTESITATDRHIMTGGTAGSSLNPTPVGSGVILAVAQNRGAEHLTAFSDAGEEIRIGGKRVVTSYSTNSSGDVTVVSISTPTSPGEILEIGADGVETQITDLNTDFSANANLTEPQEFTFDSDGHEIHGWVFLPEGDDSVPLLFNIHGGPAAQYTWGFFDEFQVYAAAGYGVVAVNPRGSSGRGQDWVNTPIGEWGKDVPADQLDLMRVPAAAAAQFPRLDMERLGIMGGSYGGLSTVMITAMDQRYTSAVAERGVYNWLSMAGTSDIPFFIPLYLDAEMPGGALDLWKASPLARAHNIETPTLIIHSEHDFRCPVEQGQQLFTLLATKGVETELLLFPPGEGHELSRSGKPKHRRERFEAILQWHERHLR
jgi:dipeptidyl aminopeptidase/acylaminoacyl peptidase